MTGDSVNLASRLQDRAGPDETLISDTIRRAVSGSVEATLPSSYAQFLVLIRATQNHS